MESNPENFSDRWPGVTHEGEALKKHFPIPTIDGQLWEKYRKTNKDAKKKSILT